MPEILFFMCLRDFRYKFIFWGMKNLLAFAAVLLFSLPFAARVFAGQVRYDDSPVPGASARPVSEELLKSTVYQIFLRPFTQEGTLKSAERLLPHVASLGVKIIQLCPVVLADDDPDKNFWSGRQRAFGLNPKNPYRQKDYFKIDPEYGSAQDLKDFVVRAHGLGMRVVYDIVYFHCGPKAELIGEHPDFVRRNPDGSVKIGDWKFPELDYGNPGLREYMYGNMEYLVREYGFDGFRCDVEDLVPLSFWEEGARRMRRIKPDFLFFSEGIRPRNHLGVYDASYGFYWLWALRDVYEKGAPAEKLVEAEVRAIREFPRGSVFLRFRDNHDMAQDGRVRIDAFPGPDAVDSMLALNFAIDGIPFLYNGNEFADAAPHSIYANREFGRLFIDWSNALSETGQKRMGLVRKLISMKRGFPALYGGKTLWLKNSAPDKAVSFARIDNSAPQTVFFAANTKSEPAEFTVDFPAASEFSDILSAKAEWSFSGGKFHMRLGAYGYIFLEGRK